MSGIVKQSRGDEDPKDRAVLPDVPSVSSILHGFTTKHVEKEVHAGRSILGMCDVEVGHCCQFLLGITDHLAESSVNPDVSSRLRVRLRLTDPGQLEVGTQFFFVRAQRFLDPLPLVNVYKRADPLARTPIRIAY